MGIVDQEKGTNVEVDVSKMKAVADEMRAYALIAIHAAGSGHPGGSLSIMDVVACLYMHAMNHDPKNPQWEDRDRLFWSAGHKAPALYVGLAQAGYFPMDDIVTLRRYDSPFQGHPHWLKLAGVEMSAGSLGQGLGVAVGDALAARLDNKDYRVYVIMGDGEQQEGSIWESAMAAANFKLDNLCAILDKNGLQIDGKVSEVMEVESLAEKYRAFNWHVIEIDGHDPQQIHDAFDEARTVKGKPTIIVADTVKGKGVSFMENVAGWHGKATGSREELDKALADLAVPSVTKEHVDALLKAAEDYQAGVTKRIDAQVPTFKKNYWWNETKAMQAEMDPTRAGFGRGVAEAGADERVVTIHADISDSIKITDFEKADPRRLPRVFSVGIAEQNMMEVAAGLAKEGKIPVTGTYGVFASGRPWDQIRTTICYGQLNVKIAGAHGGISVGPDGATHQALEEISLMACLPNMNLSVPADAVEARKATLAGTLEIEGPVYIRFAREATPLISTDDTPFEWGKANVIRYRGEAEKFIDAFETKLASAYVSENEDLALVACGPVMTEAMRAAWLLKEEYGIETRVLNIHTVKPLDTAAVAAAADEVGTIITVEEHQVGGFGNLVAAAAFKRKDPTKPLQLEMMGVPDTFGESGMPWELMKVFGLTAEHIARKALDMLGRK
ncbi:MAG: transketolase [Anaerolineaceae bacterium]|nr:transketolase [Anaerolineaceae bacterium]